MNKTIQMFENLPGCRELTNSEKIDLLEHLEYLEYLNRRKYYTLDDNKNVVPCTIEEWGKLYDENRQAKKIVNQEYVDNYFISTIFLGINHSFNEGELTVFETMVFDKNDNGNDIYCTRCGTYEDALNHHQRAVKWVENGCKEDDDHVK